MKHTVTVKELKDVINTIVLASDGSKRLVQIVYGDGEVEYEITTHDGSANVRNLTDAVEKYNQL